MSHLDDWDDPKSTIALIAAILAVVFAFSFLVVLVEMMPVVAALVVMVVIGMGLLGGWWVVSNHSDAAADEEEPTRDRDPLSVLKERYARGDISEETFEHQVTMLLDVDDIAGRERDAEPVTERN